LPVSSPDRSARSMDRVDVYILGDSWAKNGTCHTFPVQVANAVGATPLNFAEVGAAAAQLPMQAARLERPTSSAQPDAVATVAIIHCGGNDLLHDNDVERILSVPVQDIAAKVCKNIEACVSAMYKKGVSNFVISDVPFSLGVPMILELIEEHATRKGCSVADAEADAIARKKQ